MLKIRLTFLVFIVSFSLFSQNVFQEGLVYVKIKPNLVSYFQTNDLKARNSMHSFLDVKEIAPFLRVSPKKSILSMTKEEEVVSRIYKLHFSSSKSVEEKIKELKKTGLFEEVEPAYLFEIQTYNGYQPNDPFADSTLPASAGIQYLKMHDFYSAFAIEKGDTNVVIGMTDTGINFNQRDTKQNLKYNWNDTLDGLNNDGDNYYNNELTDNFRGWDVADWDNNPTMGPGSVHGMAMISIVAATPDNNLDMVGTGFNSKFVPYKVAPNSTPNSITVGYDGLYLAALQGCDVILCSWGLVADLPQIYEDITTLCVLQLNAVIIGSAGNQGKSNVFYPASHPFVVSVGALRADSVLLLNASNYNYHVDLTAMGDNIRMSNGSDTNYKIDKGTSASGAIVTGFAALVRSHFPEMSAIQIIRQMKVNAVYIDSLPGNKIYAGQIGKMINPAQTLLDTVSPGIMTIGQGINDGNSQFDKNGEVVNFDLAFCNVLRPSKNVTYSLTAITNNFEFLNTSGSLPDLNTMDTLIGLGQLTEIDLYPSTDTLESYIARIDYSGENGYFDHDYIFFKMQPTSVTSLNASNKEMNWLVYPSVFTSEVNLEGDFIGLTNIQLLNAEGKSIWSTVLNNSAVQNVVLPANLENGAYFMYVSDLENQKTFKINKIE